MRAQSPAAQLSPRLAGLRRGLLGLWACCAVLGACPVQATGLHSYASYRALEKLPEVAHAPAVNAETLESFLRDEENLLEALLASQEAWALGNLDKYPPRPVGLAFMANPTYSDLQRRQAFLAALRLAPQSKFALYTEPDDRVDDAAGPTTIQAGDTVSALAVVATATDEPLAGGLDAQLWEDSGSEWGRQYRLGNMPIGNPHQRQNHLLPLHAGFFHEDRWARWAASSMGSPLVLMRHYQFSTLAALAFRTGHPYWGWRFAGLSLHYVQDLTQPYRASYAPGESSAKLWGSHALAFTGLGGWKANMAALQSNRRQAVEKYLLDYYQLASRTKTESPWAKALTSVERDNHAPLWNEQSLRTVVASQAATQGPALAQALVSALPAQYVNDPAFDFSAQEAHIELVTEPTRKDQTERTCLDAVLGEVLANFGTHSRNALRAILNASNAP